MLLLDYFDKLHFFLKLCPWLPDVETEHQNLATFLFLSKIGNIFFTNLSKRETMWDKWSFFFLEEIKKIIKDDGAWREEVEIELRDLNDESYNGTITMQEAKYDIFRDCLGFKDFKNFDGVRFSYKGIRIVTWEKLHFTMFSSLFNISSITVEKVVSRYKSILLKRKINHSFIH